MVVASFLNPIMGPLLKLEPLFAIVLVSFILSLLITLAYKKFTNQDLMKRLKDEIKELQTEMKTLKNDPNKLMQVQKQAMETNTKYMMHSLKPTLFTFIPIILIFGWLNAHMAYFPLVAGDDFTVTAEFDEGIDGNITIVLPENVGLVKGDLSQAIANNKAEWVLNGKKGEYVLNYEFGVRTYEQAMIITNSLADRQYEEPVLTKKNYIDLKDSGIVSFTVGNEKIRPFKRFGPLGAIPWIGNFGWLGTYILFSIAFSMGIRKVMKVY